MAILVQGKPAQDQGSCVALARLFSARCTVSGVSNTRRPIFAKSYTTLRVLSQAIFGEVRLVCHVSTGRIRAVKIFCKSLVRGREAAVSGKQVRKSFSMEQDVMMRLRQEPHPGLLAACKETEQVRGPQCLYIVMPFLPDGDLLDFVTKNRGAIPDKSTRSIILQTVSALIHLHNNLGVIHGDISPENVLVLCAKAGRVQVQLCDYGLACKVGSAHHPHGKAGYKAPELHTTKEIPAAPSSDIFSLGVVVFIVYYGFPCFSTATLSNPHFRGLTRCTPAQYAVWLRSWGQPEGKCAWALLPMVFDMLKINALKRPSLQAVQDDVYSWSVG